MGNFTSICGPHLVSLPDCFLPGSGPPPLEAAVDGFDAYLEMSGMEFLDPEYQDVVGKDPDESWSKNLWLFNIRDDPNEGKNRSSQVWLKTGMLNLLNT